MAGRALVVAAVIACANAALAQPTAPEKSEADQLFERGRAALAAGRDAEACDLFEQSLRKDPRAVGTLLNLGLCNERRGKIATALRLFQEAFDRASEAGLPNQTKAAQEKIVALSPRVPVLVIQYAVPPPPGAKLLIDDTVVERPGELAVDPGTHAIVLTAPGRLPYQSSVSIEAGARKDVVLPALELPKTRTVIRREGRRRTYGMATALTGAGLVVIASGIAGYAKYSYEQQFDDPDGPGGVLPHCGGEREVISGMEGCDRDGQRVVNRARTLGITATVIGGIGLAGAGVGLALWLTAPDGDERAARVVPSIGPDSLGAAVVGRF